MSRLRIFPALVSALLSFTSSVAGTQQHIPIRQLGAIEARSTDTVTAMFGVRELSDGRIIANDAGSRRLMLFDASLKSFKLIADTANGTKTPYGTRETAIITFHGDSTLLVDTYTRGFVVIAPNGTMGRIIAAPRSNDVAWLANSRYGFAGIDPKGRLIYRGYPAYVEHTDSVKIATAQQLDSAPIVRADFETRMADTIALLGVPTPRMATQVIGEGKSVSQLKVNPLPLIDDWVMLPDGSVAVLRGRDYHIDWINADGTKSSSPKMPFDWKRLSETDKQAIVDSAKRVLGLQWAASQRTAAKGSGQSAPGAAATFGAVQGAGGAISGSVVSGDASSSGTAQQAVTRPPPVVVSANELPDYIPPVLKSGAMRSDPQGNVWILPSTSAQSNGGLLYDVVNREGQIIERVQLPAGRALVGFGAKGVVYLTAHDSTGAHVERARLATTTGSSLP